jgi:hypothetical protein
VTLNATVSEPPALKVTVRVPAPPVIVPFVIDHEYVAPTPASGTEAVCPAVLGHTDAGAVIVADGEVLTTTFVIACGDVQPATVAVTLYVPEAESPADGMEGFWELDVNPLGPVHEYVVLAIVDAESWRVCPTQIGPLLLATGAAGIPLTVRVAAAEVSCWPNPSVTTTS